MGFRGSRFFSRNACVGLKFLKASGSMFLNVEFWVLMSRFEEVTPHDLDTAARQ